MEMVKNFKMRTVEHETLQLQDHEQLHKLHRDHACPSRSPISQELWFINSLACELLPGSSFNELTSGVHKGIECMRGHVRQVRRALMSA